MKYKGTSTICPVLLPAGVVPATYLCLGWVRGIGRRLSRPSSLLNWPKFTWERFRKAGLVQGSSLCKLKLRPLVRKMGHLWSADHFFLIIFLHSKMNPIWGSVLKIGCKLNCILHKMGTSILERNSFTSQFSVFSKWQLYKGSVIS